MEPSFELNNEAIHDLPEDLKSALTSFMKTKSEEDLSAVVAEALKDFSSKELPNDLSDSTNFIKELGLDSLAITEFVFFFEDLFNLKITNEDLLSLQTIGNMKTFLMEHLSS